MVKKFQKIGNIVSVAIPIILILFVFSTFIFSAIKSDVGEDVGVVRLVVPLSILAADPFAACIASLESLLSIMMKLK